MGISISEDELPPSLAIDARVASFRIQKVLGRGGFAITYQVEDISGRGVHRTQKYYALKEFFPFRVAMRADDGRVVARHGCEREFIWGAGRFVEEALVLQHLRHDNIVKVEGILAENGTIYMLMEFIDGDTLRSAIESRGPQNSAAVRAWLIPVLNTLEYVHRPDVDRPGALEKAAADVRAHLSSIELWKDITIAKKPGEILLHLDLTPQNIMFRNSNQPVLIDFGASRHKIASAPDDGNISIPVANTFYAPREQFSRQYENLTPRTDLFSLAGCAYFALTGNDPIPWSERSEGVDPMPKLIMSASKINLDDALMRSISAALSLSSSQRPASASIWNRMINRSGPSAKVLLTAAFSILALLLAAVAVVLGTKKQINISGTPVADSPTARFAAAPTPLPRDGSLQPPTVVQQDPTVLASSLFRERSKPPVKPMGNPDRPPSSLSQPPAQGLTSKAVVGSGTSLTVLSPRMLTADQSTTLATARRLLLDGQCEAAANLVSGFAASDPSGEAYFDMAVHEASSAARVAYFDSLGASCPSGSSDDASKQHLRVIAKYNSQARAVLRKMGAW